MSKKTFLIISFILLAVICLTAFTLMLITGWDTFIEIKNLQVSYMKEYWYLFVIFFTTVPVGTLAFIKMEDE